MGLLLKQRFMAIYEADLFPKIINADDASILDEVNILADM